MTHKIRVLAFLGLLVAGLPGGCAPDEEAPAQEDEAVPAAEVADSSIAVVALLAYSATVPGGWEQRPVRGGDRLIEFTVPAVGGGEAAEVVVYYFGRGEDGDVQAAIDRWTSQFTATDGGPIMPSVAEFAGTAFRTVLVDYEGEYGEGIGTDASGRAPKPGQALTAAVIATPRGNLFAQLFGPISEVRAARDGFIDFAYSIRE